MRLLPTALLVLIATTGFAAAAPASFFDQLFPGNSGKAHHRVVHKPATRKPAVKPKAQAPADKPEAQADKPEAPGDKAGAPVPLPRIRPEERATAAAAEPADSPPADKTAPAAETAATPPPPETKPEVAPPTAAPAAPYTPPLPEARPADAGVKPAETASPPKAETSPAPAGEEGESTTPKPPRIYQTACPAVITGLVEAKPLPPISEGQCAEQSPLSVTGVMVNGRMLKLTAPAVFNCSMATDLPGWVADVDNYIQSTQKTRIKAVMVGGTYECRPRNIDGGSTDLSEHGRADAIDFVGFTLEDGRQLTVTNDYNSSDAKISRLMHFAHDAACTRFTTVLGPDANALHHDHFHLDLGCHGKTCTYRLCE